MLDTTWRTRQTTRRSDPIDLSNETYRDVNPIISFDYSDHVISLITIDPFTSSADESMVAFPRVAQDPVSTASQYSGAGGI